MQASYIINFTYHRAINMTPYEAVFHMKAKRKLLDHDLEEGSGEQKRKEIREAKGKLEDRERNCIKLMTWFQLK